MNKNMWWTHIVAFVLTVVGALNWGLVGLFNFNLVNAIFGFSPTLERVVYILVGLAAVWLIWEHKTVCRYCGKGK